jgi:hypothetical protein
MAIRVDARGRRVMWAGAAVAAIVVFGACNAKGGRTEYSNSPDSGAAAPATQLDSSMRGGMPDSTTGGPDRTGKPGVAGDTLSTRGQPAGTGARSSDTANKAKSRPKP